jgi:hypothetical protein
MGYRSGEVVPVFTDTLGIALCKARKITITNFLKTIVSKPSCTSFSDLPPKQNTAACLHDNSSYLFLVSSISHSTTGDPYVTRIMLGRRTPRPLAPNTALGLEVDLWVSRGRT